MFSAQSTRTGPQPKKAVEYCICVASQALKTLKTLPSDFVLPQIVHYLQNHHLDYSIRVQGSHEKGSLMSSTVVTLIMGRKSVISARGQR